MPDVANMVPVRARTVYREMGLMVDTSRLPFVASVRYLASASPDSTLLLFAMSLANRALNFRRDSSDMVADYHVELTVRSDSNIVRQVNRDEKVRVRSVAETMRRDESIIFQQILVVRPGIYTVSVVARDRTSPAYAHFQLLDTVPQFGTPGLGWPLPIYEGAGRTRQTLMPELVANPRGATPYGESARFYVEGYGFARGTRVAARIVDLDSVELWRDTLTFADGPLATVQFVVKPGVLPVGRAMFEVHAVGGTAHTVTPLLITFSDGWAVQSVRADGGFAALFPPPGPGGDPQGRATRAAGGGVAGILPGERSDARHPAERAARQILPSDRDRQPALRRTHGSRVEDRPRPGVHHAGRC